MYRLGLVGHPVEHSSSPDIHKNFLNQIQAKGKYELFDVKKEDLPDKLKQLKRNNIDGFNVTIPYKESIVPLLDELDPLAEQIGSVNTVKSVNQKFVGYNTDGLGYIDSLKQSYPDFIKDIHNRSILIIGAGGAARGIYYSLQKYLPKNIDVTNRTLEKANKLIHEFPNSDCLSLHKAEQYINNYDLIIQTTSVGMTPNQSKQPLSLKFIKSSCIVSEIIYKPQYTKFLLQAQEQGASLLLGMSMLWYQAAKSFEIWTGQRVIVPGIEGR